MSVSSGQCSWCGWEEIKNLEDKDNDNKTEGKSSKTLDL